ncbi:hypothetical protein SAZ11_11105 [Streptomyces sp. FXJ1.4098]|nr:hypothetical protein [Streptomyces sp. FXJ1.4098]
MADRINATARSCGLSPEPQLALFHHCLYRLGHTLQRHATHGSRPWRPPCHSPPKPHRAPDPSPTPRSPWTAPPICGRSTANSPWSHRGHAFGSGSRTPAPPHRSRFSPARIPLGAEPPLPRTAEGALTALLTLLHSTGFLHPVQDARRAETADLPPGWSFHELLAYDGARAGPRDRVYGPVFPLRDTEPPPPPVTRPATGRTIPLRRPDLDKAAREDRTFTAVLESRTSRRTYGERPVTRDQLGSCCIGPRGCAPCWPPAPRTTDRTRSPAAPTRAPAPPTNWSCTRPSTAATGWTGACTTTTPWATP